MSTAAKFVPKVIGRVTRPTLQMKPGEPIYVKITTTIVDSKQTVQKKGQEDRKPAKVMNVIDLTDKVEKTVVCNKVLVSDLSEVEGGYVGKCFMITKSAEKKKGDAGEYYRFDIALIEEPK
jgi:hypothetical protein